MIQAIGLTSTPRGDLPPLVDDATFEARPGQVTGLLGDSAPATTTLLRLMLELEPGRGVTLFDGSPLHRHPHPARQAGALLGDVPGHPGRTARSHLRMLAAATGVPAVRAEQALEAVGLTGVADHRLGALSLGMDRRLGLATALLGEPRALLLDDPARDLSPRDTAWLHGLLKSYAARGGTVVVTGTDPQAMTRLADRIVTLDHGRITADQPADEFARTRLRPYVAVQSPHAQRLAALLADDGAEVATSSGNRIAVYGTTSARIGETAYRNGILLHRLAEETADTGPTAPLARADGRQHPARDAVPPAGPARPFRYELRRFSGVRTPWLIATASLLASVACTLALLHAGQHAPLRLVTGWPHLLPLPPAALGAGLLGALAYGQEFRYPALTPTRTPARRQLRLLIAKLTVSAAAALLLAATAAALGAAIYLFAQGPHPLPPAADTAAQAAGWAALAVGCAWAGLLAAAVFRTTALGMAAVLAVPLLVAPALGSAHPADEPVRQSLALSLAALLCAYLEMVLRIRDG
ncbi:ATP-binding cassette domain-containing protein [Actinacidiphila oryziradicis]|uniref:ATP-binding cassette domain-containing protein n=1 Tax=Actinacidiphila oryziradicis TaxID=2571141 RepID=UPI0023EF9F3C|nr:ATP-binding cassette domain-containing protein [Actinacidiphila oryziradicis]MCW2870500.1 transporter-like protein [Actinacidiphila oryziradicis]